MPHQWEQRNTD